MTDRPSYDDLAGPEGLKGVPEKDLRRMLNLENRPDIQVVNLDDQREPPEHVTAGWKDSQIKAKTPEEIQKMIDSANLGIANLRETVAKEQERLNGLYEVQMRKKLIGGS